MWRFWRSRRSCTYGEAQASTRWSPRSCRTSIGSPRTPCCLRSERRDTSSARHWPVSWSRPVVPCWPSAYLRRLRLWAVVTGVLFGWGICLLLVGATGSLGLSLAAFGAGGLIWAPYPAVSLALFQRTSPVEDLMAVLAANRAVTMLAPPL